jgi:TetR/AcrR family transcriptional regulator, mexJK operon transcriptional repressor
MSAARNRNVVKKALRLGGRPSREASALLGERILEIATELFFAEGYGGTTIELVAKQAGVSKRTFYHRFPDKPALFGAVVHRIIDRLRPADVSGLFAGSGLEEILTRLARAILRAALDPQALALHRVVLAEGGRFPELAVALAERSAGREAVERIGALLQSHAATKDMPLDAARFAATQFLQMVIALPQRRALGMGRPMTPPELEVWARQTAKLFLNGCRGWSGRNE